MVMAVAGNWLRIARAVASARPAVSGSSSNLVAKPVMSMSSSEPGVFMVLNGELLHRRRGQETSKLQKRRAYSKLSGTLSDARTIVNMARHPVLWSTQTSDKNTVDIETRSLGNVKLLKITGRINLGAGVDRLRDTLEDLLANGSNRWVLDLADVAMIDSSGIGLLVRYLTNAKQQGGDLKLLNPTKFALQTLKMIGLLNLFEVYQEQEKALAAFK